MNVISGLGNSGFLAQSAYSASVASYDSLGREITSTYMTAVDMSNYYPKSATSGAQELADAFNAIPLGDEEVNQAVHTNSATWNTVTDKLDTTSFSDISSTFLTAQQNADWTATAGVTQILNKPEEVSYEMLELSAGPGIDIQDTQDALVISSTIDISNKLDTTAFADVSSTFLTGVPEGTMNESLFTYNASDKITAYNGSAFAGQGGGGTGDMDSSLLEYNADDQITGYDGSAFAAGSFPEGTMIESNLEYNAVGEISGYGNSAIAQYGAEKQWLVHDDTIVHQSNSAQYAFGVNLSAVAQLLGGVDETIIFDGSVTGYTSAKLSENVNNFNRVKVFYSRDNSWTLPLINSIEMCTDILSGQLHGNFTMGGIAIDFTNNMDGWYYATVANITDDVVSAISGRNYKMAGSATFDGNFCLIKRIIGIGRRQ